MSPKIGAIIKGVLFAEVGFDCSFVNNFIASASGCGSPVRFTLFGPFRNWKYPRNLRSINV